MTHNPIVYINAFASGDSLSHDIRELIPNAMQRRRMSDIVRQGVAVGMECMLRAGADAGCSAPGAIITATGFGCLADSEKFLESIIASDEQLLSPTPFIQSTFNTIGGQLAIMLQCHAPNVTYSQRSLSFESALLDAVMQILSGEASDVLVGAFDLNTPTLLRLMGRMGIDVASRRDGVYYFLLSGHRSAHSIAALSLDVTPGRSVSDVVSLLGGDASVPVVVSPVCCEISSASALCGALAAGRVPCAIVSSLSDSVNSIIRISPC